MWGCSQPPKPSPSPSSIVTSALYPLLVKEHEITVELACTVEEQSQGLMFRQQLKKDHGMLFIFSRPRILSFWMKNTLIPLDIAYIDSTGNIIEIQSMDPETITPHPSISEAQYALEMNRGWFSEQNIAVGTQLKMPDCPHQKGR